MPSKISTNYNHGFTMNFDNGLIISVQFGAGNYCSRRRAGNSSYSKMDDMVGCTGVTSNTAEVAIWDTDRNSIKFDGDSVYGWCPVDKISHFIYITSVAKDLTRLQFSITRYLRKINNDLKQPISKN